MQHLAQTCELDFQQRSGALMMFRTSRELELAQPMMELLGEIGGRHELLDIEAARQLEPALSTETAFHSALYIPDDWSGNCPLFVRQMKSLAQDKGVEFHFNTEVQAIRAEIGGMSFQVEGRSNDTDAVVVAAGSDSVRLLKAIGISLPLYPVKVYSASTPIQEYELAPQLSVFDDTYRVGLTRLGKRIRIAGCAELGSSSFDLNQKAVNTLVKVGDDWFPNAANYRTASFWCGPAAMLPEGVPLLGATRYSNVFINTGHGAGAWALAAAAKAGNMRNLQSAYLRGNQLGDVGLKALCEALAEPKVNASAVEGAGFPKLQCVHLSDNQIGDDGCLALAEAIEAGHVDHVRLIQMSNNVQTRDGFEVVHDALEEFEKKRLIQVHF
jgi:D-amino-acid dehydrogenase